MLLVTRLNQTVGDPAPRFVMYLSGRMMFRIEPDVSNWIMTMGGTVRDRMSRSPACARASFAGANASASARAVSATSESVCCFMVIPR